MNDEIRGTLATFAVAAWSNDKHGVEMADAALDSYIEGCAQKGHDALNAMRALEVAYAAMKGDSGTAETIGLAIRERIARLQSSSLRSDVRDLS